MTRTERLLLLTASAGLGVWLYSQLRKADAFSLKDKVVFITGGSRGLGLVLARELTRLGARVAICARDEEELDRAEADVRSFGLPPLITVADVTNAWQVRDAITRTEREFGEVDVLINNAGIISVGPTASMTREDFEESLDVSFWGAFNTIEAVLPSMRARRSGRIINISSVGGKISIPHLLPYCVGKFALVGYSQGLHSELAPHGIAVTTVCPGLMRTGSARQAQFKGDVDQEYAWFKLSSSLPILTASAESAARQIVAACQRGDAELVISWPAKLAVFLNALSPELAAQAFSLVSRILPSANGPNEEATFGKELEPTMPLLTRLTDQAAKRNNEVEPNEIR